jgi:hypothetical protein
MFPRNEWSTQLKYNSVPLMQLRPLATREARPAPREHASSSAERGLRILFVGMATFLLLLVAVFIVGEHWGTQRPVPGHSGPTVHCRKREVICVAR